MASYKSLFSPPTRPDAQVPPAQRAPSASRLPTRSTTPTSQFQARPPVNARLQKKKSAKDNVQEQSVRNTGAQKASVAPSKGAKSRQPLPKTTTQVPNGNAGMTLPRYTSQPTSSRLPKYEGFVNTRTPSLVSGSSASTIESPKSLLRRKPSSIGRQAPVARPESMSSQEDLPVLNTVAGGYNDPFSETVLGITLPPPGMRAAKAQERDPSEGQHYGLDAPPGLLTDNLPPTPLYALSATPSTHYSGSPTSISHISTPTSMSSHSPGILSSHKPAQKPRQTSPLQSRPPVTRRRADDIHDGREPRALSSVRESTTSSSSASTVRVMESTMQREMAKNPLPAPLPSSPLTLSPPLGFHTESPTKSPPRAGPPTQVPPEFAHLVDPVQEKPVQTRAPARPSRDGTPDISALRQQSPIIQSNMSSLPSHHRRQSSGNSRLGISGTMNESASRLAMPTKIPSRNPSPNPNLVSNIPRSTSRNASSRGTTPDLASDTEKKTTKGKSLTAPSPTKATSRFGFFSRRTKTEPALSSAKPEKRLRKGPAAGTGHEGYGKFAARGRSGSTTSGTGSVGRSASADSITPSLERTPSSRKSSVASQVDDFFLDRLTPVVIRGTGSSTEICRSPEDVGSTTSLESTLDRSTPDPRPKPTDLAPSSNMAASQPTLLPSAMPNSTSAASPMRRFGLGIRRPSEGEDEKKSGFYALANRRSSRRSQLFGSKDSVKAPADSTVTSPKGVGNSHARRRSDVQTSNDMGIAQPASVKAAPEMKTKTSAPPKLTRKWNFFQRTQVTSPTKATFSERQDASIKLPPSRSVAHYALDSVDDHVDIEELGTIMKDADQLRKDSAAPIEPPRVFQTNRPEPKHVQSILLPSPPALPTSFSQSPRPASPQVQLKKENRVEYASPIAPPVLPEPSLSSHAPFRSALQLSQQASSDSPQASVPARPSRLAQVGRIPQVVSQRERERKLSDQSFSRPFVSSQPRPSVHLPTTSVESFQVPLLAESSILTDAYPAYSGLSTPFNQATFEPVSPSDDFIRPTVEFLTFPPRRKGSELSSNSSGFWSVYASTAIIPPPGAPPGEDEVWGEYDDLIDDVLLSPQRESDGSSLGAPSQYGESTKEKEQENARPVVPTPLKLKSQHSASNSVSSNPATQSVHLRRSRLLSALHAASPKSTLSISDFLAAYGDRHPSVIDSVTGRLSLPSTHRSSTGSGPAKTARSSLPASVSDHRQSRSTISSDVEKRTSGRYRDSKLMEMADAQAENGMSMADLRFGALMTSKWLSFGRVLFSPVHFELKDPTEDRILVIDGLGKDWSYYCALTYSEAFVYNLGPTPENATISSNPTPWSSLPNHRHIHHPSMSAPFPFPRGFFAAVVYRFPVATSESLYRFAVSECKRVLRPGGYLELSVLDIELLNMGNRARRAVRGLKVQMQVAEPGVCLKPASDMTMRLLGKKGFENINRCLVGVPVAAGRLGSWSSDASSEERTNPATNDMGKSKSRLQEKNKGRDKAEATLLAAPQPTFTDLLTTPPSPDPKVAATADANITSMVAQVGRWWYSKCYESTVSPDVENQIRPSIWADGKLLRECEKRGTGFRLLVAYAQRPNCAVRRTVSV